MKIVPLIALPKYEVEYYWQTLYVEGTLDKRLCDIVDPTWSDVKEMIVRMGRNMYMVTDKDVIVAEFMLENPTGRAWQIHFSIAPFVSFKQAIIIGTWTSDRLIENFTLYGLTPVTNREACLFTLKTGFKKVGILPQGINDRGKIVDAMISVKAR